MTLSASTGTWTGTKPISYAYQWVRCGADGGQPDGGNCAIVSGATSRSLPARQRRRRLPHARSGHRDQRRRLANGGVQPDGRRRRCAGEHVAAAPFAERCSSAPTVTADPGSWTGSSRSRTRTGGFGATRRAEAASRSLARTAQTYRLAVSRRQPQDPLQRHRAELARLDDGLSAESAVVDGAAAGRARSGCRAARSRSRRRACRRTTG